MTETKKRHCQDEKWRGGKERNQEKWGSREVK